MDLALPPCSLSAMTREQLISERSRLHALLESHRAIRPANMNLAALRPWVLKNDELAGRIELVTGILENVWHPIDGAPPSAPVFLRAPRPLAPQLKPRKSPERRLADMAEKYDRLLEELRNTKNEREVARNGHCKMPDLAPLPDNPFTRKKVANV